MRRITGILIFILPFSLFLYSQEKVPVLTFACLSDTHAQENMISTGNLNSIRLRSSFVNSIDRIRETEDIDVLVLGGDYSSDVTIQEGNWKRLRELMAANTTKAFPAGKARTPVVYTVGNHDFEVANFDKLPKSYVAGDFYAYPMRRQIGYLTSDECFYEMAANALQDSVKLLAAYHYQIGGFDFVVQNCGKYFFKDAWNYRDSQTSCEWVAAKLDEIDPDGTKTIFYINHLPLPGSKGATANKTLLDNAATGILTQALARHPGVVYLYGHDHSSSSNMSYITDSVSQRVTEYDNKGNIVTDSTVVSTCYLKGVNTKRYVTGGSTIKPTTKGYSWKLLSGGTEFPGRFSFRDDGGYSIFCGTTDRFYSDNGSGKEPYKYGYIYEYVSDTAAVRITDIHDIKYGRNYVYVAHSAKDSTLLIMKNSYFSSTPSYYGLSTKLKNAPDTLFVKTNNANLWTFEKDWTKSFVSCFMGSMRYNNLDTNKSPSTGEPQIVQALIVRVYDDSIVLDMKNYGETGQLNYSAVSPYIAGTLKPFVISRATKGANMLSYSVAVTGSDEGAMFFDGREYHDGDAFMSNSTISEEQITAKTVGSLYTRITIGSGRKITVSYSQEQPTIDYPVKCNVPDGSVIYKGIHYKDGETIKATSEIAKSELAAEELPDYESGEIHLNDQGIEVDYFERLFDPSIAYVIEIKKVPDTTYGAYLNIEGSAAAHALRSTTPCDNYIAYQAKGYYYINAHKDMSACYLGAWTWNATISADPVCWTIEKSDDCYVFNQKESTHTGYLGVDPNDRYFYCNKTATPFVVVPSSAVTSVNDVDNVPSSGTLAGKFFDGNRIIIVRDSDRYNLNGTKE